MTVAVCLQCGVLKHGAWTACPQCSHTPESHDDMARHVMASDHYLSHEQLAALGARIAAGEPVHFDEGQVMQFAAELQSGKASDASVRAYAYGCFGVLVLIIVGVIFLVSRLAG